MNLIHIKRRQLFAIGGRWAAAAGVAASLSELVFPGDSQAASWKDITGDKSTAADGTVKSIQGSVLANGQPLKVGDAVHSGSSVLSAAGSHMVVTLQDGTIFQVKGQASFVFHSFPKRKRGIIDVALGALLAVVPTGNRYLINGPTATIGIKGTVFFRQVFTPNDKMGQGINGQEVRLPKDAKDIFCVCNGAVDYLEPSSLRKVLSDEASHHSAYFLGAERPLRPNPAVPINHTDAEIAALIQAQEGAQHDASWLR